MVRSLAGVCAACLVLLLPVGARAEKKQFNDLTFDQVQKKYNELSEDGWTPLSITGKEVKKESRYDMTWADDKIGGWYIFAGLTTKEFQEKKDDMKKQGLKLHQEDTWKVAGEERCAGVWLRVPDGRAYWTHKKGAFEHKKGKLWEEVKDGKVVSKFVEEGRTKEYVEMHEKGRDVTLRLYSDRVESKGGGRREKFKSLYDGKWGSR